MAQVCMTKLFFLYSRKLQWPRGYQDSVQKFQKNFLTFLGLGTNVVKVSSVSSELLFQSDTLRPRDYNSFTMAILSQKHREINIAESILLSIKDIIRGHEKGKVPSGLPNNDAMDDMATNFSLTARGCTK